MTADSRIHFYDAADPGNVPSGVYAAAYVNGYAWPDDEVRRMGHVIRISVERDPEWAKAARVLDIENGAALPADLPAWIRARFAHVHTDDATAYVNRSNWAAAWQVVKDSGEHEPLWWVATLDGTQDQELRIGDEVVATAWAVQYFGGGRSPYDLSVLHGVNNFGRP